MATVAEINAELVQVNTAISAILSGGALQSYSLGGRSYTMVSYGELLKHRDQLRNDLAEAEGSSSVILASFKGGRGP